MGVKFGTSWRNFREFSKSPSWREFLKNIRKSMILEKIVKGFLLMEITHRGLSRPRYRPPTPVLMDEVKVKVKVKVK